MCIDVTPGAGRHLAAMSISKDTVFFVLESNCWNRTYVQHIISMNVIPNLANHHANVEAVLWRYGIPQGMHISHHLLTAWCNMPQSINLIGAANLMSSLNLGISLFRCSIITYKRGSRDGSYHPFIFLIIIFESYIFRRRSTNINKYVSIWTMHV